MRIFPCIRCYLMPLGSGPEGRPFRSGTCKCRPDQHTRIRLQDVVNRRHREAVEAARVSDARVKAKARRAAA